MTFWKKSNWRWMIFVCLTFWMMGCAKQNVPVNTVDTTLSPTAHWRAGLEKAEARDFDAAIAEVNAAQKQEPNIKYEIAIAHFHFLKKDYGEARDAYRKLVDSGKLDTKQQDKLKKEIARIEKADGDVIGASVAGQWLRSTVAVIEAEEAIEKKDFTTAYKSYDKAYQYNQDFTLLLESALAASKAEQWEWAYKKYKEYTAVGGKSVTKDMAYRIVAETDRIKALLKGETVVTDKSLADEIYAERSGEEEADELPPSMKAQTKEKGALSSGETDEKDQNVATSVDGSERKTAVIEEKETEKTSVEVSQKDAREAERIAREEARAAAAEDRRLEREKMRAELEAAKNEREEKKRLAREEAKQKAEEAKARKLALKQEQEVKRKAELDEKKRLDEEKRALLVAKREEYKRKQEEARAKREEEKKIQAEELRLAREATEREKAAQRDEAEAARKEAEAQKKADEAKRLVEKEKLEEEKRIVAEEMRQQAEAERAAAAAAKQKARDERARLKEERRLAALAKKEAEQKRKEELKKVREEEKQRRAEERKQKEAERNALAEQKRLEREEQKRLEAEQKQAEREERLAEQERKKAEKEAALQEKEREKELARLKAEEDKEAKQRAKEEAAEAKRLEREEQNAKHANQSESRRHKNVSATAGNALHVEGAPASSSASDNAVEYTVSAEVAQTTFEDLVFYSSSKSATVRYKAVKELIPILDSRARLALENRIVNDRNLHVRFLAISGLVQRNSVESLPVLEHALMTAATSQERAMLKSAISEIRLGGGVK